MCEYKPIYSIAEPIGARTASAMDNYVVWEKKPRVPDRGTG